MMQQRYNTRKGESAGFGLCRNWALPSLATETKRQGQPAVTQRSLGLKRYPSFLEPIHTPSVFFTACFRWGRKCGLVGTSNNDEFFVASIAGAARRILAHDLS